MVAILYYFNIVMLSKIFVGIGILCADMVFADMTA